jgi:hypothetical protein
MHTMIILYDRYTAGENSSWDDAKVPQCFNTFLEGSVYDSRQGRGLNSH